MANATGSARRRDTRGSSGRARLDRESIIAAGLELRRHVGHVHDLGARARHAPRCRSHGDLPALPQQGAPHAGAPRRTDLAQRRGGRRADPLDWRDRLRQLVSGDPQRTTRPTPPSAPRRSCSRRTAPASSTPSSSCSRRSSRAGSPATTSCATTRCSPRTCSRAPPASRAAAAASAATPTARAPGSKGPILADPRKYPLIQHLQRPARRPPGRDLFSLGVEAVIQSAERVAARDSA